MASRSTYEEFCKVRSTAKCDTCHSSLKSINDQDNDNRPLTFWCEKCQKPSGIDDTYSEDECRQLTELLKAALENGMVRATMCQRCHNDDMDKFVFDEKQDQLILKCVCCGFEKSMEDTSDVTSDEAADSSIDDFPIVCDCGNAVSNLFDKSLSSDGTLAIIQCHKCHAEFYFHQEKGVLECEKNGSSTAKRNKDHSVKKPQFKAGGYHEITRLDQLHRGDHIFWKRSLCYSHHAIVTRISRLVDKVKVIHYTGNFLDGKGNGSIKEEWLDVDCPNELFYQQDYDACYPPKEVIQRARSRLGEHNYNMLVNNCEHFAHWCKTGTPQRNQVGDGINSLKKTATNVKSAQTISSTTAYALKGLCSLKRQHVFSIGFAAFELWDASTDVIDGYRKMQAGDISKEEFIRVSVERGFSAAGAVLGAVIVPASFLMGQTLGAVVGRVVGKFTGRHVAKLCKGR